MPRAAAPAARRKPSRQYPLEYNLLLTVTLCLLAAGAVMVYSASSARTLLQGQGDGTTYLVRYVLYGAVGFAALHVLSRRGLAAITSFAGPLLAISFGLYGLIRKVVAVEAVPGLAVETILLTPLAVAYLLWCEAQGTGSFGHTTVTISTLLALSGLATALPLGLFSFGARRIPLSTVGLIQYLGPTLQLLLGVTVFGEPFTAVRAVGFAFIWLALAVYAADGLRRARAR